MRVGRWSDTVPGSATKSLRGDLVEFVRQTATDARRTHRRADVKEGELRDPWSEVRDDNADANQRSPANAPSATPPAST